MTFQMTTKMAAFFAAGLLASAAAHADTRTLSGQFFDVSFDTSKLPSGFTDVRLVETPFEWDCSGAACNVLGSPTASVVFQNSSPEGIALITQDVVDFEFKINAKEFVNITDPRGNAWGIAAVDNGLWTIGANVVGQETPDDALFATSLAQLYGYVQRQNMLDGFIHPIGLGPAIALINGPLPYHVIKQNDAIGLNEAGWLAVGPEHIEDSSMLMEDGTNLSSPFFNSNWKIRTELYSAHYVTGPSSTVPRCQSLSCMTFAPGALAVDSYAFTMPIVATMAAVPETGTLALSALGLALMGWQMRRRAAVQQG